jgi:serine phosphatase RsbU (regulator of sigma subunit)
MMRLSPINKSYIPLFIIIALIASLVACDKSDGKKQLLFHPTYSWADSLILREGIDAGDTARSYFLIDSLEQTGDLNELGAETFRLITHQRFYHLNEIDAEVERLGRQIATHNSLEDRKQWYYNYGVSWLAYELYMTHNYDGFLRVAVPLIASMDSLGNRQYDQMTNVLTMMACCYVKLGEPEKAKAVADRARSYCWEILAADSSVGIHQRLINCYARVKDAYVMVQDWEQSKSWFELVDSVEQVFRRRHPDARVWKVYDGYIHLDRATRLWIIGQKDSAAAEYDEYCKYETTRDVNGYIQANDYLMPAERWKEAAENYEHLDEFIKWRVPKVYLEEIHAYYLPKFRANINAGRNDSALYTAKQIAERFDSAYMWQKRSQMAEMATVYDIQGKEMQIAEQKASLLQTRVVALLVAIVLLTVVFVVYSIWRRRTAKMKAAQQRIEGELQIARDIQMSMVSHTFPHREGLDMYASMTPAKEVGGDLYGYVVRDQMLYFAVGDVSGKGVPASLFMAQATRLFQTMADQGMMPAEICTRMNTALGGEDNANGMFVTMFVGMLNMDTGHLHFCNAGHNPPVIGGGDNHGDFMQMEPNAPIGLWPDLQYVGEEIDSVKGRPLFIYTDGLNEAEDSEQRQFGDERLLDILRNTHFDIAQQVIETLAADVEAHRKGAEPNDDLTMLCLRVS